jgi:hypothetical protein
VFGVTLLTYPVIIPNTAIGCKMIHNVILGTVLTLVLILLDRSLSQLTLSHPVIALFFQDQSNSSQNVFCPHETTRPDVIHIRSKPSGKVRELNTYVFDHYVKVLSEDELSSIPSSLHES